MKTQYTSWALLFLCALLIDSVLFANTYPVINGNDSGAGSLRSAVDSANASLGTDTITLSDTLIGGTIKITSGHLNIQDNVEIWGVDTATTVLDACDSNRIFLVSTGDSLTLIGVKLQNGFETNGGAIYNNGYVKAITSSFTDNTAEDGGAIYSSSSGSVWLYNTSVINNHANDDGGAFFNFNSTTLFIKVKFLGNTAVGQGGAINNLNGETSFYDCSLSNNSANLGGAIYFGTSSDASFMRTVISGNTGGNAGGIYNSGSFIVFTNSILSGNQATGDGGAVYNFNGDLTINNSTISGNLATTVGGGIYNLSSNANITNSILAENSASGGPDIFKFSGNVEANYSLIRDATGSDLLQGDGNIFGNTGNPVDPLFVETVPIAPSTEGDLNLLPCSPAINAGINDSLDVEDSLDLAGNPRIAWDTVDMGAYEYNGVAYHGPLKVITINDSGCGSLRYAVANAVEGDTICFDPSINGDTIKLTSGHVEIEENMFIIGNDTSNTIIDACDSSRIFKIDAGDSVEISGITIQNGYATGSVSDKRGGGVNNQGFLNIESCLIQSNYADSWGGGVYNSGTLHVVDCKITGNSSGSLGGGVFCISNKPVMVYNSCISGNFSSSGGGIYVNSGAVAMLSETSIIQNSSSGNGGGARNQGTINFNHSVISGNIAAANGGACYNSPNTTSTFTNTRISGNTAQSGAGVLNTENSNVWIKNSTISGNVGSGLSGGIHNVDTMNLSISNSIIAGNSGVLGPDIYNVNGAYSLNFSLIGDTTGSLYPSGAGNLFGTQPNPLDPIFLEEVPAAPTTGGDLRLQACSPAINKGNNDSLNMDTSSMDILGNPRVAYGTVDMGAYEFTDPTPMDTSFISDCGPCTDTLVLDAASISGFYQTSNVIRIEGNVTVSSDTWLWAREIIIDPVFEAPKGVTFNTVNTPCSN